MEKVLPFVSLLLQSLTLAGVGWLWWKRGSAAESGPPRGGEDLRREMRSLERYIEGKVDLLLAQILAQKPQALDLKELVAALGTWKERELKERSEPPPSPPPAARRVPEPEPLPVDLLPQIPQREGEDVSGAENRLANALNHSEFLSDTWPEMSGPFEEASGRLLGHLSRLGLAEPEVAPFPPVESGGSNHWLFLTVAHRDPQTKCRRLLIPRHFSLYDPLQHDHLFNVRGLGGRGDLFVKDLRECAVLDPNGALEGLISKNLVIRRGVFVV